MSPLFLASIIGSVTWLFVGVVCIWITGIKVRRGQHVQNSSMHFRVACLDFLSRK